ncbi:MAG: hypothetical protein KGJ62_11385 [Armatimonadetes bacterium]|nr:hypothetical protein [Armatimonadota bacterium]
MVTEARPIRGLRSKRARRLSIPEFGPYMFFGMHAPLAILMWQVPIIASIHAGIVFVTGLFLAVSRRSPAYMAGIACYIAGSEVMWRLSQAPGLPWEFAEYSITVLLSIYLIWNGRLRKGMLPLAYIALLTPAAIYTLFGVSGSRAHAFLAFDMSGPIALAVCCWFFYNVRLTRASLLRALRCLIAPTLGLATILVVNLATSTHIDFGKASNFAASAGYGPNEVSGAMGLGVTVAFMYALQDVRQLSIRVVLFTCSIGMAALSAITFSRTGLYLSALSITSGVVFMANGFRNMLKVVLVGAVAVGVSVFIVLPILDSFTQGALVKRFEQSGVTHRDVLALDDVNTFLQHPLFGVGVGLSTKEHFRSQRGAAEESHTEPTRDLAEHGLLGVSALIILLVITVRNIRSANGVENRSLTVAWLVWAWLYMCVSAMRTVAPGVLFGLSCAAVLPNEPAPAATDDLVTAAALEA